MFLPSTTAGGGGGGFDWKSLVGTGLNAVGNAAANRGATGNAATPGILPGGGQQGGGLPTWANIAIQGGGLLGGMLAGKQATKSAMQRTPEEQRALAGAYGIGDQASRMAQAAYGESRPYMRQAGGYYSTLLGGNRAAMSQALAGPTAQITDYYRGAGRNLRQSGIRGAARDVAAADLNRQRASQLAGLATGVQPYAADALAKLGIEGMQTAGPLLGTAGNIYGNLLNQGAWNRQYGRQEGEKTGTAIGGFVRDIGDVLNRPRGGGQAVGPAPNIRDLGRVNQGTLPGQVPNPAPAIPNAGAITARNLPGYAPNPYGFNTPYLGSW
jgi:hypothetical protein